MATLYNQSAVTKTTRLRFDLIKCYQASRKCSSKRVQVSSCCLRACRIAPYKAVQTHTLHQQPEQSDQPEQPGLIGVACAVMVIDLNIFDQVPKGLSYTRPYSTPTRSPFSTWSFLRRASTHVHITFNSSITSERKTNQVVCHITKGIARISYHTNKILATRE